MKIVKSAFACAAAAGLLASQVAVAAPAARTGSITAGPADQLGGGFPDGSAPVIAIISLLALVALIVIITDDDDESPVSP